MRMPLLSNAIQYLSRLALLAAPPLSGLGSGTPLATASAGTAALMVAAAGLAAEAGGWITGDAPAAAAFAPVRRLRRPVSCKTRNTQLATAYEPGTQYRTKQEASSDLEPFPQAKVLLCIALPADSTPHAGFIATPGACHSAHRRQECVDQRRLRLHRRRRRLHGCLADGRCRCRTTPCCCWPRSAASCTAAECRSAAAEWPCGRCCSAAGVCCRWRCRCRYSAAVGETAACRRWKWPRGWRLSCCGWSWAAGLCLGRWRCHIWSRGCGSARGWLFQTIVSPAPLILQQLCRRSHTRNS